MMNDPFMRMLRVPEDADAARLLGLPPGPHERWRIDAALRHQSGVIDRHPEASTLEALRVREALRRAADRLRIESSARSARGSVLPALTDFDRTVLAVLIAGGGWNRRTRDRLVAVAAMNGVTVRGLLQVIRGLAERARSHGPRLGMNEILRGRAAPTPVLAAGGTAPALVTSPPAPSLAAPVVEGLGGMHRAQQSEKHETIRLAVLFGLVTILVAAIVLRLAWPERQGAPPPPVVVPPSPASTQPAQVEPPVPVDNVSRGVARFTPRPTFLGNGLPVEAVHAADTIGPVLADLEDIAQHLEVSGNPSEAIVRRWREDVRTVGAAWMLLDESNRRAVRSAIHEVFRHPAGAPEAARLLSGLGVPHATITALDPVNVWRGTWMTGALGDLAASPTLTDDVRVEAARHLALALPEQPGAGSDRPVATGRGGFISAATAWLDRVAAALVADMQAGNEQADHWELWLSAQRELGEGRRRDAALLRAVRTILSGTLDVRVTGPALNVLARLLDSVPLDSLELRAGVLALFDDADVSDDDLWIVTSLLATGPASALVPETMVHNPRADRMMRSRTRDRLAQTWPEPSSSAEAETLAGIPVDSVVGARWLAIVTQVESAARTGDDALMALRWLVIWSRLNEAASDLIASQPAQADGVLDEVARLLDEGPIALAQATQPATPNAPIAPATPQPGITPPGNIPFTTRGAPTGSGGGIRTGQAIGPDGQWRAAYEQLGRSVEQRMEALRALRNIAGTDLGPLDAYTVVREALRGTPQELRAVAQTVLQTQFANGPVVCMELLDQLPDAPVTNDLSECLEVITASTLPAARSAEWGLEARRAVVDHLLSLRSSSAGAQVKRLVDGLNDSLSRRRANQRRVPVSSGAADDPNVSALQLQQAWQDVAAATVHPAPAPDSFAGLLRRQVTRRRLADGPVQTFCAHQIGTLEFMAYIVSAELPERREEVLAVVQESQRARRVAGDGVSQAIEAERGMARLARVRMVLPEAEVKEASTGAAGHGTPPRRSASSAPMRMRNAVEHAAFAFVTAQTQSLPVDRSAWADRLERLDPAQPLMYFELAEEIMDVAASADDKALARRLFGLAAALDRARFGRSACLAIAYHISEDEREKRELRALAGLLDTSTLTVFDSSAPQLSPGVAMDASIAISSFRIGRGDRALTALRKASVSEAIQRWADLLPGGMNRFIEDCNLYRAGNAPPLSAEEINRLLRIESAILAGSKRSWSTELLLRRTWPLSEVAPEDLEDVLRADPSRPIYRDGRWIAALER